MTDSSSPTVALGIDLGTTNSLAAVQTKKGPKVLRDRDGNALIPSVVHYGEDGAIVVGLEARALQLRHPERTVSSVKRLVGRSATEAQDDAARLSYRVVEGERGLARVAIDDRRLAPEQVSAEVLKTVRARAEEAMGTAVDAAVITVPAYFDDTQRQATKDAAELAGLRCLRILNEPTAASLAYGIDGTKDGTVLVYDLGGGTFDVSILKIRDGVFQVLATAGDTHLGGDDFDHVLVQRIHEVLTDRGVQTDGLSAEIRQAIRSGAEGLKCQLSSEQEATLSLTLGTDETSLTVARQEFEARIAPLVDKTLAHCQNALKDAGIAFADVDDVVLVGGSTRVPLVRQRLAETSGKELNTEVDPDLAVAQGAAIQADSLAGGEKAHLLLDVIPLSLGLETMGGAMSKLILRNATIPTSQMEEFSTQVDNQTAVDINVYQGEREMVDQCRHLGSFKLRGIPPMPAGLPRIEVTFLVDADGVLRVRAKETRTQAEASIQIVPSFGLTRAEVRRMMEDSIEHAHEDMALREDLEIRNKAQAMVRGTTRALELSDLPPDQTWSIQKATRSLGKLLEDEAPLDQIRPAVDELSELTASVADDVISSAVHKALTEDA